MYKKLFLLFLPILLLFCGCDLDGDSDSSDGSDTSSETLYVLSAVDSLSKIISDDGAADDEFGSSISLSSDGSVALIGAPGDESDRGVAYIFTYSGGSWSQTAKLTASDGAASDDSFGQSVSLSSDGTTALIGAYFNDDIASNCGAAYIYHVASSSSWTDMSETAKLTASDGDADDRFGFSVCLSADGATALISAHEDDDVLPGAGAAYIYHVSSSSSWSTTSSFTAKLTDSDVGSNEHFGSSVSLSSDGTTALIVGNGTESAFLYHADTSSSWATTSICTAELSGTDWDYGFDSTAISGYGTTALLGMHQDFDEGSKCGAAYIYHVDSASSWSSTDSYTVKLSPSDLAAADEFGISASISSDGTTALIGSHDDDDNGSSSGSAYIYNVPSASSWSSTSDYTEKLTASDGAASDEFGLSVCLSPDGSTALVGAPYDDDKGSDSGSVYSYGISYEEY